jgi:hypothetical protein
MRTVCSTKIALFLYLDVQEFNGIALMLLATRINFNSCSEMRIVFSMLRLFRNMKGNVFIKCELCSHN